MPLGAPEQSPPYEHLSILCRAPAVCCCHRSCCSTAPRASCLVLVVMPEGGADAESSLGGTLGSEVPRSQGLVALNPPVLSLPPALNASQQLSHLSEWLIRLCTPCAGVCSKPHPLKPHPLKPAPFTSPPPASHQATIIGGPIKPHPRKPQLPWEAATLGAPPTSSRTPPRLLPPPLPLQGPLQIPITSPGPSRLPRGPSLTPPMSHPHYVHPCRNPKTPPVPPPPHIVSSTWGGVKIYWENTGLGGVHTVGFPIVGVPLWGSASWSGDLLEEVPGWGPWRVVPIGTRVGVGIPGGTPTGGRAPVEGHLMASLRNGVPE